MSFLLAAMLALSPPATTSPALAELQASQQELVRAVENLAVGQASKPYWARLRLMRAQTQSYRASFGGMLTQHAGREATGEVEIRVGSREHDNTGYISSGGILPLDVTLVPNSWQIQATLWRALDLAYRGAVADETSKQTALTRLQEHVRPAEHLPAPTQDSLDKTSAQAKVLLAGDHCVAQVNADPQLAALTRELSAIFLTYPAIDNGDVTLEIHRACHSSVDHQGNLQASSKLRGLLSVRAQTQAEDGMRLDHARVMHWQGELGDLATIRHEATQLAHAVLDELSAISRAPLLTEDYDGPILLREQAAAQFLASTAALHVSGEPGPLADSGRILDLESQWSYALGKDVLAKDLSLVEDPTGSQFASYTTDANAFPAKRVTLVDHGKLVDLLYGDRGRQETLQSNGHARMTPSLFEAVSASNLELTGHRPGKSLDQLHKLLLARAREDGYEYAIEIELLRDANLLGPVPRESANTYGGSNKIDLPVPALIYRIGTNGQRKLLRGAFLAPASLRSLRRIRAYSREKTTMMLRVAPGLAGGLNHPSQPSYLLRSSIDLQVRTPSLLIDGLEILSERGEQERPPILQHPLRNKK